MSRISQGDKGVSQGISQGEKARHYWESGRPVRHTLACIEELIFSILTTVKTILARIESHGCPCHPDRHIPIGFYALTNALTDALVTLIYVGTQALECFCLVQSFMLHQRGMG